MLMLLVTESLIARALSRGRRLRQPLMTRTATILTAAPAFIVSPCALAVVVSRTAVFLPDDDTLPVGLVSSI